MVIVGFGERLKELREKAGLTQEQLAIRVRTGKSSIAMYETQGRIPSPAVLLKLSGTLHVSTDYLLGADKVRRLDVSGLTEKEIDLIEQLVQSMREKNVKIKKF